MRARQRRQREQGQTMVEMAIVLPVLLMILFAILQFGIVFHDYLALTDAVRVGARKAAVSREVADPPGTTIAAVKTAAVNLDFPPGNVQVSSPGAWAPGTDVTVTGTYPYSVRVLGIPLASGSLSSSTTERIE